MKNLILLLLLFSATSYSQVMGDIANDGRAITKDIEYELEYKEAGVIVFDIVVNMDGEVTSCKVNRGKTTTNSTPLLITGKNRVLSELAFEVGYAFPKWHNGMVQFTVVEEEKEEE